MLAARGIIGIAFGFTSCVIPIYSEELALPQVEGALSILSCVVEILGEFIGSVIVGIFAPNNPYGEQWRWMFAVPAIIATMHFFAFLFMPESPRWLLQVGRAPEALEILKRLRSGDAHEEFHEIQARIVEAATTRAPFFPYPDLGHKILGWIRVLMRVSCYQWAIDVSLP